MINLYIIKNPILFVCKSNFAKIVQWFFKKENVTRAWNGRETRPLQKDFQLNNMKIIYM